MLIAIPFTDVAGQQLPLIRRTEYGVPHILAYDFRGVGMGLGYTQVEDYGTRVILGLLRAKGVMGRTFGRDSMQQDFAARLAHDRAVETYHLLDADTRGILEGFAEGVNIYIRTHSDRLPAWAKPIFNGHDVAALDIGEPNVGAAQRVVLRQLQRDSSRIADERDPDEGSNAWAFAPSRTKSGRAILLRNPHLSWDAGYWEAHVTIPGRLNFYGDFRLGGPFGVIGGFNERLGWSTTNNQTDSDEVYALDLQPWFPNRYYFDGSAIPLEKRDVTVEYMTNEGMARETRTFWYTKLGPVVHRTKDKVYVIKAANDGEYRAGQQFVRMMKAQSLNEWKQAMAMRARPTSNFTYADRAGNIALLWNGSVPRLPHPHGGDSTAVPARRSDQVWTELIPFEAQPMVVNPPGGYVHNENDAPYYSNLKAILDTLDYPSNIERPRLGLRSQHALQLIANNKKLSLEDVVTLKHSMRMLLADRVKPDLLAAARASQDPVVLEAAEVLRKWDNTVAAESRGGLLFETWWRRYSGQARDSAYAHIWHPSELTTTPRGIGQPARAIEALQWAANEMKRRYGALDVPWGDVHRVRRGAVDVPVGGCTGALGCFRVLSYTEQPDGKRAATTGDGWVLAVEFTDIPRAYSVLAYGQSPNPASPHHDDQAALFARGQMKPVRFTEADIARSTIRQYRPGQPDISASAPGETVQYRSSAGFEYRSWPDTGAVARAESALAADPRNVERFIQLGVAQSGVRQFREAIQTFSRGLEVAPDHAMLYRWRGHRHLSVREFDRALADLTRGLRIDSTNYGILYHLGIVRYVRGEFAQAADAFARAQKRAPDAGELAGATDWLWMSLSRAGRRAEAKAMLDQRPDSLPINNAYSQRLKLYRGEIRPDQVLTTADTGDVNIATLAYGVGNWYLLRGDTVRAREWFERSVQSGGWPAFGFIVSEVELRRLRR